MMQAGFIALTIINISAAVILFGGALSERMRLYPTWHKIGLVLAAFGLVAQALRNVHFLLTGESPSDLDFPFWALKDLGIAAIAFFYLSRAIKGAQ